MGGFVFAALAKAGGRLLERAESLELTAIANGGDEKPYISSTDEWAANGKSALWAPIDSPPAV